MSETSCRRSKWWNDILKFFLPPLEMEGKRYYFAFQLLQKAFGMTPNQMKCAGQTSPPAEMKILVKFKFDYACCCVTVQNLTLGSSHKSIQCPENCFRWRPRADVTAVRATALEFGPDQVKSRSAQSQRSPAIVKKCGLPFFSQWVVFGSLLWYMPSPQVQGHELSIGQASFTSKAQEVLNVENTTSLVGESFALCGHRNRNDEMSKVSSENQTAKLKWELLYECA